MHFSARANWMMFTKEERRNIAIYILGISMFRKSTYCLVWRRRGGGRERLGLVEKGGGGGEESFAP